MNLILARDHRDDMHVASPEGAQKGKGDERNDPGMGLS